MENKLNIGIVFGGQSTEHEVSRLSAQSIIENINNDKFDIQIIGITKDGEWLAFEGDTKLIGTGEWEKYARSQLEGQKCIEDNKISANELIKASAKNKKIDLIIPVLHGINGEDGTIQGLFELAGIPYVGCGVLSSSVGMDKIYSKIIFEKEGIPQANYLWIDRNKIDCEFEIFEKKVKEVLAYPCFIKPSNAGSSVGVSKAKNKEELYNALINAGKYDRKILVEEYINGREIECAILGNYNPSASVLGEVIPCNEFYDYKAKYIDGDSQLIIPAPLDDELTAKIRDYAVRAFKALDCSGLSRVDFFVEKTTGQVYLNEINTLPGFTSISMYSMLWKESGIDYPQLIEKLIELGLERYELNKKCTNSDD